MEAEVEKLNNFPQTKKIIISTSYKQELKLFLPQSYRQCLAFYFFFYWISKRKTFSSPSTFLSMSSKRIVSVKQKKAEKIKKLNKNFFSYQLSIKKILMEKKFAFQMRREDEEEWKVRQDYVNYFN